MKKLLAALSLAALVLSCAHGTPEADTNTNGIWLWSKYMNEVNLDTLASKDIGNIILHEVAFKNHGEDSTLAFIHSAQEKGMKVHIKLVILEELSILANLLRTKKIHLVNLIL